MAVRGKGLQAVVLGTMVLGGYWLLRGRHRYDPLSDQFDFDHSPTTRHMVDLKRRVDKERVAKWLSEQEQQAGQAAGQPPDTSSAHSVSKS